MPFSLSSKYASNKVYKHLIDILTWFFRILVGSTFIISGFVKAIDPWGSIYKFQEYLAAVNINSVTSLLLSCAIALCALEFIIGISLVTGSYRKSMPVVALIFMCAMLPLTLWIAIANPVKDCGCFGDFILLSNWATFWKNVVLTCMIVWLIKFNHKEITIISPAFQWLEIVASIIFILALSLYGYLIQPLIDFRPYPVGDELLNEDEVNDDEDENLVFIYSKDGIEKEFSIDDELPDESDGWTFVKRENKNENNDRISDSKTLRIWDADGDTDITKEVLDDNDRLIILLIPDLNTISPATTWKINELYDKASDVDITMISIVNGNASQIDEWKDLSMPQYEIYTADDTAIKEVSRGNPSIIYLENGIIRWKSTLSAMDSDYISDPKIKFDPMYFYRDGKMILFNLAAIYIIILAFIITLSMLPRIKNAFTRRKSE